MVAEASGSTAANRLGPAGRGVRSGYFRLFVALTLVIVLASFFRDRGQLLSNISFWLFSAPALRDALADAAGVSCSCFLLTVSVSLNKQLNALLAQSLASSCMHGPIPESTAPRVPGGMGPQREDAGC